MARFGRWRRFRPPPVAQTEANQFSEIVRPSSLRRNAFDGMGAWPSRLSGRAVQFDGIGDDADDAAAAGALELRVAGRGVFAGEKSAAKPMGFLNDPKAVMIAAQRET